MRRERRRGSTLLEAMVGAAILAILTTAVFAIFKMGIGAWFKADGVAELQQQGQAVGGRWVRETEVASLSAVSLSATGDACSLPSAITGAGVFALDPATSELIWQSYQVYYFDGPSGEVRYLEVPIAPPTSAVVPIEQYTGQPLANSLVGGRVLARWVTSFEVQDLGGVLRLTMVAQRRRPNSMQMEVQTNVFSAAPRN
ncbi:hypothetical protein DYH09_10200 [bacterium CPR1]|nr:hypothetical protein [bacterium CPR1]